MCEGGTRTLQSNIYHREVVRYENRRTSRMRLGGLVTPVTVCAGVSNLVSVLETRAYASRISSWTSLD